MAQVTDGEGQPKGQEVGKQDSSVRQDTWSESTEPKEGLLTTALKRQHPAWTPGAPALV